VYTNLRYFNEKPIDGIVPMDRLATTFTGL